MASQLRAVGAKNVPVGRVFHTLDALRGIAAIGVVVFHMKRPFGPIAAPGGYLAVDLFFMMSGVVLSHAYEIRFRAGMGTLEFMRVRLIRLYPLYWLGLLLGIAVTAASLHGHNIQNWETFSLVQAAVLGLLLVPNFSVKPVNALFPLNIPCWSLFLEILVNILFVVFWRLLTSRRLIVVSLLTGCMMGLAILHQGNIDQGAIRSSFIVGLARAVFGFAVGVLIARHIAHRRRLESNLGVLAIVTVVCVAIAGWPEGQSRAVWDTVCALLVFPLIVCCGTLVDPGPLLRKLATFLGITSYAVYVLHNSVSSVLNSAMRPFERGAGNAVGAPYLGAAVLALLLTGCWMIDRYFDTPIRRQLGRVVPKMRTVRAESSTSEG